MKRKRFLIGTLVMSVGGLAIDQVFLGPGSGPTKASAEDLMAIGAAALDGTTSATEAATTPDSAGIRDVLATLGTRELPAAGALDAFSGPRASTERGPSPAPEQRSSVELGGVLTGRRGAAAIINGLPLRVGETREGITLVSAGGDSAVVRVGGRTVRLTLER